MIQAHIGIPETGEEGELTSETLIEDSSRSMSFPGFTTGLTELIPLPPVVGGGRRGDVYPGTKATISGSFKTEKVIGLSTPPIFDPLPPKMSLTFETIVLPAETIALKMI